MGVARAGKCPVALREAWLLIGAALVVTGLSWLVRPDGLPLHADPAVYRMELEAPLIDVDQARAIYDEGLDLFVDTRPGTRDERPTIPGAVPIRQESFDDDLLELFDFLVPEDHMVLFGNGDLLRVSGIAGRLKERGYGNIVIMRGGIEAWRKAGGPLTAPPAGGKDE